MIQVPFAPFNDSFWYYQHLCGFSSLLTAPQTSQWLRDLTGFFAEFFHHMKEHPKPQSDSQTDDRTVVAYCYPEKKPLQQTGNWNESTRFMDANSTYFVLVNKSYWNTNSLQLLSFLCDASLQLSWILLNSFQRETIFSQHQAFIRQRNYRLPGGFKLRTTHITF